jgi:hypothetical protein
MRGGGGRIARTGTAETDEDRRVTRPDAGPGLQALQPSLQPAHGTPAPGARGTPVTMPSTTVPGSSASLSASASAWEAYAHHQATGPWRQLQGDQAALQRIHLSHRKTITVAFWGHLPICTKLHAKSIAE